MVVVVVVAWGGGGGTPYPTLTPQCAPPPPLCNAPLPLPPTLPHRYHRPPPQRNALRVRLHKALGLPLCHWLAAPSSAYALRCATAVLYGVYALPRPSKIHVTSVYD